MPEPMSADTVEPPRLRRVRPAGRPVGHKPAASKVGGRRGRPSQDDYAQWVIAMARADLFHLEECAPLAQLPGVRALARQYQRAILPTGAAIRELLDEAVTDVQALCLVSETLLAMRVSEFLRIWYREGDTVVRVATELKLSRSYIVHTVQRRALDLVAKRFLDLAWRAEASA
jgi:hypothetical protein